MYPSKLIIPFLLVYSSSSVTDASRITPEPSSISVVYPILTDALGQKISDDVTANNGSPNQTNNPRRTKRQAKAAKKGEPLANGNIYISISHNSEEILLELAENRNLITPRTTVEWITPDGRKTRSNLSPKCYLFGKNIKTDGPSLAAVSNCNGLVGYIQTGNRSYFIEPLSDELRAALDPGSAANLRAHLGDQNGFRVAGRTSHVIYSIRTALKNLNLSVQKDQAFRKRANPRRIKRTAGPSRPPDDNNGTVNPRKGGKRMAFLYKGSSFQTKSTDKQTKTATGARYSRINCKRHAKNGRQPVRIITTDDIVCKERTHRRIRNAAVREHRRIIKERRRRERERRKEERRRKKVDKALRKELRRKQKRSGRHVKGTRRKKDNKSSLSSKTNTLPEPVRGSPVNQSDTRPKWLEITVGIDHTVIEFHGEENVEKYVTTLFNIVSAIYQDPSLQSNLQVVLSRLIFYKDKRYSQVRRGFAKKSLESVNRWAEGLHEASASSFKHDLAVWLTKYDLGGPSGYAPVAGICEPQRSCTLNRDEGLTSAFIIAHEMGHVLGMSHDGDYFAGNKCASTESVGLVMAPLVVANFDRFHWSSCSKTEYHKLEKSWHCLLNEPASWENTTLPVAHAKYHYSLDEQCKLEFGDGYGLCQSYGVSDPCIFLQCSHVSTFNKCKARKISPIEGTICGLKKWCQAGVCRPISKVNFKSDWSSEESRNEVLHPLDRTANLHGDWTNWSEWGPCSRTCGLGISVRVRMCGRPQWKRSACKGNREEWRTCSAHACPSPSDLRGRQCQLLKYSVILNKRKATLSWLPYESGKEKQKCKLTCVSRSTNEIYMGKRNLLDGTKCSYDKPDGICVQGKCIQIGCDGNTTSLRKADICGVCGGDNSTCVQISSVYRDVPSRGYTEVITFPEGATQLEVQKETQFYGFFALQDSSGNIVLNGQNIQDVSVDVIVEGSMFHYNIVNGRESILATGPLLNPVSVLFHGSKIRVETTITTTYMISRPKKRTDLRNTNCLASGDGCKFRWFSYPWQLCSATCGKSGIQVRAVSCVNSSTYETITSAHGTSGRSALSIPVVDPILCTGQTQPDGERSCNRFNCPGRKSSGWSACSTSCGLGHQLRRIKCVDNASHVYRDCATNSATEMRVCVQAECPEDVCRNGAKFCAIHSMRRYCTIPKYRSICCLACSELI